MGDRRKIKGKKGDKYWYPPLGVIKVPDVWRMTGILMGAPFNLMVELLTKKIFYRYTVQYYRYID